MKKTNHFPTRISKDEVNAMPLATFKGKVYIINNQQDLDQAAEYIRQQDIIGIDTETRPTFNKGEHHATALLQIATRQRCYLFQLMQTGLPESITAIFSNPEIKKIGLAFKDDLNGLKELNPFTPNNCIDLQKIVPTYGIFDLGLQKIFAIVFKRKISKVQQLTNWEQPNLTKQQALYAATDAWATLLIYLELQKTKKLTRQQYLALKNEDIRLQQLHQQEILAERQLAAHQNQSI